MTSVDAAYDSSDAGPAEAPAPAWFEIFDACSCPDECRLDHEYE